MPIDSTHKIALITGAGSGVGRASALALMAQGYTTVLFGRRKSQLEETLALGAVSNTESIVITGDVCDASSVHNLFDEVNQRFGRLDLLFNNAGIGAPTVPIEELTIEDWQNVVNTNLTGTFLCTQEAFRIMKSQNPKGGRIINNGSISADRTRPMSAPYTSTKHAITGLTKATSLDGREHDIVCGQIDIGNAATEMTQRMSEGVLQANGVTREEPVMDVQAVADAIVYMAELPLDTNVQFMTVMATKMPYIGRG